MGDQNDENINIKGSKTKSQDNSVKLNDSDSNIKENSRQYENVEEFKETISDQNDKPQISK